MPGYAPYYPGGWHDFPSTLTPISSAALANFDNGITAAQAPGGLQYLAGGGALTTAMVTATVAAGFTGWYLDPRFVWTVSGLVFNNIQNFRVVSHMQGSIGWLGHVAYNTSGYISTGTAAADGIQIYATSPSSGPTQGIIFENCVIAGSNPGFGSYHLGGGQRDCGLVNCLVYNTSATAGSYAVLNDSALSDNNSENNIFLMPRLAGAYAALGIGIGDQTQIPNDTTYYDLRTKGGTYSVVKTGGGNHIFVNYYDRSSPTTATVWNHGGGRLTFIGGEDQNGAGLAHLIDAGTASTHLRDRSVTQFSGQTTTVQVSAGTFTMRGSCPFNLAQTLALSGTGVIDLSDRATVAGLATISGSSGTLILAGDYSPNAGPVLSSWTGTTIIPLPGVVASGRGTGFTTTQTVTWTPPAVVGTRFRVSVAIHPTVAGTSTVPVLAFTEIGGTARSAAIPMWQGNGAAAAPSYLCAAADSFYGSVESDTDGTATPVTLTITPTGSTFRYSAVIEWLT